MAKLKFDKGAILTGLSALFAGGAFVVNALTKKNDEERIVAKSAEKAAEMLMGNANKEN